MTEELIINLGEDLVVNVHQNPSDDVVVNYAEDILVKVRSGEKVQVELTQQGPAGPKGNDGTLTPELIAAKDEAAAAAVAAGAAQSDAEAAAATAVAALGQLDGQVAAATAAADAAEAFAGAAADSASAADTARGLAVTAKDAAQAAAADADADRIAAQTAATDADADRIAAETAKTDAVAARVIAVDAAAAAAADATAADQDRIAAEGHAADAAEAQAAAEAAALAAQTSASDLDDAVTAAINAKNAAVTAQNTAMDAAGDALASAADADASEAAAETAQTLSEAAQAAAEAARDAAQTEASNAAGSATTAGTARAGAEAARDAALGAQTAAEASALAADQSEAEAIDAALDAQAAKTLAETAASTATQARIDAQQARTEAQTAAADAEAALSEVDDDRVAAEAARVAAEAAQLLAEEAEEQARLYAIEAGSYNPDAALTKAANGSDIPDKPLFLTNIGAAPIDSPEIIGTPTAPTPAAGNVSQRIATTEFVKNKFDELIGGASSAYDTFAELQAMLEDDSTGLSALLTQLGTKADKTDAALLGTPTAPTAAPGTNTIQIATTAYVIAALDALGFEDHTHDIADIVGLAAALAALAPKNDAALTGNPTAPTQVTGNNSTRIATTAFVAAAVSAFAATLGISSISGLTAALAGKADAVHSHAIADVLMLQAALDAKWDATSLPATAFGKSLLNAANQGAALTALGGTTNLATVSQAEAEAGSATVVRGWTAERVRQAIVAYAGTAVHTHPISDIVDLQTTLDAIEAKADAAAPQATTYTKTEIDDILEEFDPGGADVSRLYGSAVGAGVTYTLPAIPASYTHLDVIVGGVPQPKDGSAYSFASTTLTLSENPGSDLVEWIVYATLPVAAEPDPLLDQIFAAPDEAFADTAMLPARKADGTWVKRTWANFKSQLASTFAALTGATFSGEVKSTSANAFRLKGGGSPRGYILRSDSNNFWFLITADGDQDGNWNTLRPLLVEGATGSVVFGGGALGVHGSNNTIYGNAVATAAQYRANTPGKMLSTDQVWAAANYADIGQALNGSINLDFAAFINAYGQATGNITFNSFSNFHHAQGVIVIWNAGATKSVSVNTTYFRAVGTLTIEPGLNYFSYWSRWADNTVICLQQLAKGVS